MLSYLMLVQKHALKNLSNVAGMRMPCGALHLDCLLCHCLSCSSKIQQSNTIAGIWQQWLWLRVQDFYGLTLDALREAKKRSPVVQDAAQAVRPLVQAQGVQPWRQDPA